MKNVIIAALVIIVVAVGGYYLLGDANSNQDGEPLGAVSQNSGENSDVQIKDFKVESYFDTTVQKPLFSLKELQVNRGDRVRIKVTNTRGAHNFYIDEYGIKQDTPLNQEVTIEFIADKSGEFIYYCNVPGHRAAGQWGTLKVI